MLENLLAAFEQEKSSRFQIIAQVDSLIAESGDVEPELPASIHDKLGRLQRHATDHIIEVHPVSRARQQFATDFSDNTGSNMNLSPLALKHEIDHCRKLIDEIACAFKMAKTPRAKNEVKAWAEKLLEHIRAKLSFCRTTDGSGNISQSSSGSKNFQLDNENILILAERELKKVALEYANNAKSHDEIRIAYMLLDAPSETVPAFIKG